MQSDPIRAPEFPPTLEWFNTISPLTLQSQKGKVVLLDFWTYCCINCMHVLPDLHYLEKKYPTELTVIGLHSPKFPNERVAEHLKQAISRYDIQHPIANDPEFIMWQQYAVHAWPTLIVIDTEGNVAAKIAGEGHRQQLDHIISELITKARQKGHLKSQALELDLDLSAYKNILAFPGKILALKNDIYISDSGHHQIVHATKDGKIIKRYGSGHAGLKDGHPAEAEFYRPQGLTLVENNLFVADTENHALRKIDLQTHSVHTIAGTGEQGGYRALHLANPLLTSLNSPWDIAYHEGFLYIAMAGNHQIWAMDIKNNLISVYAGTGRESIEDGDIINAALAQPSGLSVSTDALFIADSETSAVRQINFEKQHIFTLIGRGLFEFGDRDGVGLAARLQHPLGVAYDGKRQLIWIADSYNHKIKTIELDSKAVKSIAFTQQLAEPGGISLYQDTLWIADTNHHRLIKMDLSTMVDSMVSLHE